VLHGVLVHGTRFVLGQEAGCVEGGALERPAADIALDEAGDREAMPDSPAAVATVSRGPRTAHLCAV